MPLYEFCCPTCSSRFEVRRSFSEGTGGVTCPACRSVEVQRVFTPVTALSSSGGSTVRVGGSGCGGCASTSCAGCGSARQR